MKYLIFLPLLLFISCEDRFLKTLDVELPETESTLAVTAEFASTDTLLRVYVDTLRSALVPDNEERRINDANIVLRHEGEPLGSFVFDDAVTNFENRFYYTLRLTDVGLDRLPAGEYTLEVNRPDATDFPTVRATQTLMDTAAIESVAYKSEGFIDLDGFRLDELKVRIADLPGRESFYRIDVEAVEIEEFDGNTFVNVFPTYPVINDPTVTQGYNGELYFSDVLFADQSVEYRLGVYNYNGGGGGDQRRLIRVRVSHLAESVYRYELSRSAFLYAQDNPFAEPVNIVGNVEGGVGVFSVAGETRREIELE